MMNLQNWYLGKNQNSGRAGLYVVLFFLPNICLKDSDPTAGGLSCVYLLVRWNFRCMTAPRRWLSFSGAVAIRAHMTDGDLCPGFVQQAGFRAWAPPGNHVRETGSLCPGGMHEISFEARLNYLSPLRSDTELFTAGRECEFGGLGNSCLHNVWFGVGQAAEFLTLLLWDTEMIIKPQRNLAYVNESELVFSCLVSCILCSKTPARSCLVWPRCAGRDIFS